jgi:type I site-specific restriction endonuclease
MNKKELTETDIRTKFITPAIVSKWDLMSQLREEVYRSRVNQFPIKKAERSQRSVMNLD